MGVMNFSILWCNWMYECIGITTTSILVNGNPTEQFSLEMGLRHDDPLSPSLFLLAAKGLNVMMTAMVEINLFKGYQVGRNNPIPSDISNLQMTHLFWGENGGLMLGLCRKFCFFLK